MPSEAALEAAVGAADALRAGVPNSTGRGAAYRTRTCDPLITNEVLYQLS